MIKESNMIDFLLEEKIRHLIVKANMYDKLGNTKAADEVDEIVKILLQKAGLKKEAGHQHG